jgi:hypothetical protein
VFLPRLVRRRVTLRCPERGVSLSAIFRLWVIGSDPRLCLSSAAIFLLLQANPRPRSYPFEWAAPPSESDRRHGPATRESAHTALIVRSCYARLARAVSPRGELRVESKLIEMGLAPPGQMRTPPGFRLSGDKCGSLATGPSSPVTDLASSMGHSPLREARWASS